MTDSIGECKYEYDYECEYVLASPGASVIS